MSSQNVLDPLCGEGCAEQIGGCGCGSCGTHTMLIERLIGNAYEIIKYVACHIPMLQFIYDSLQTDGVLTAIYNAMQTDGLLKTIWNTLQPGGIFANGIPSNSSPALLTTVHAVTVATSTAIDATTGSIQVLSLTMDVTSSSIAANAGNPNVLVLRFIQDATGGRAFTWPTTIASHGDIALAPNAISQQIFAKNADGTYDYVAPMMYPRG